jgi:hypothetical protein
LLNVGFNVVSTEIVFGCIFKRNVLGGIIGDSTRASQDFSLDLEAIKNLSDIFYVSQFPTVQYSGERELRMIRGRITLNFKSSFSFFYHFFSQGLKLVL